MDLFEEIFDLVDTVHCFVASFEGSCEWVFVVDHRVFEMHKLLVAQTVHDVPGDFARHHALAVGHFFGIEVGHVIRF